MVKRILMVLSFIPVLFACDPVEMDDLIFSPADEISTKDLSRIVSESNNLYALPSEYTATEQEMESELFELLNQLLAQVDFKEVLTPVYSKARFAAIPNPDDSWFHAEGILNGSYDLRPGNIRFQNFKYKIDRKIDFVAGGPYLSKKVFYDFEGKIFIAGLELSNPLSEASEPYNTVISMNSRGMLELKVVFSLLPIGPDEVTLEMMIKNDLKMASVCSVFEGSRRSKVIGLQSHIQCDQTDPVFGSFKIDTTNDNMASDLTGTISTMLVQSGLQITNTPFKKEPSGELLTGDSFTVDFVNSSSVHYPPLLTRLAQEMMKVSYFHDPVPSQYHGLWLSGGGNVEMEIRADQVNAISYSKDEQPDHTRNYKRPQPGEIIIGWHDKDFDQYKFDFYRLECDLDYRTNQFITEFVEDYDAFYLEDEFLSAAITWFNWDGFYRRSDWDNHHLRRQ